MSAADNAGGVPGRIGLHEAVAAIREELELARREGTGEGIRFGVEAVNIEFEVAVSRARSGDARVKVWVVEAGGGASTGTTTTHRVGVTLAPRTADGRLEVRDQLPRPAR